MSNTTKKIAALTLCLLFAFANASAQEQFTEWASWSTGITGEGWSFDYSNYKNEDAASARDLWQKLETSKLSSSDSWAGDYSIGGDTFLSVYRWTPEGGYVHFAASLCEARVRDFDFGDVVVSSPHTVELVSRYKPNSSRKFVKVKWGEQRFLVPEDEVSAFCDYVVGRDAVTDSGVVEAAFFIHRDDKEKQTDLLPAVPPEYQKHVRRPFEARITKVGRHYIEVDPESEEYDDSVTPVTINIGSDQGLKRGMKIPVLDSDEYNEQVEVTRVAKDSARGIIVRTVRKRPGVKLSEDDDGTDAPRQPIVVGWRLTTSVHKQMQRLDESIATQEANQPKP